MSKPIILNTPLLNRECIYCHNILKHREWTRYFCHNCFDTYGVEIFFYIKNPLKDMSIQSIYLILFDSFIHSQIEVYVNCEKAVSVNIRHTWENFQITLPMMFLHPSTIQEKISNLIKIHKTFI